MMDFMTPISSEGFKHSIILNINNLQPEATLLALIHLVIIYLILLF